MSTYDSKFNQQKHLNNTTAQTIQNPKPIKKEKEPKTKNPKPNNPLKLYLHIPFYKSIYHYYNFNHNLLKNNLKHTYVDTIYTKIHQSNDNTIVNTIYFGDSTPSLLTPIKVRQLLTIYTKIFTIEPTTEINLEVNPETTTTSSLNN